MVSVNPIPGISFFKRLHIALALALIGLSTSELGGSLLNYSEAVPWERGEGAYLQGGAYVAFFFIGLVLLAMELGFRKIIWASLLPAIYGVYSAVGTLSQASSFGAGAEHLPLILPLCFAGSLALVPLLQGDRGRRVGTLALAIEGSLLLAAGCSMFIGRHSGLPAIHWGSSAPLPSAVAALVLLQGAAFLNLAWREDRNGRPGTPDWLPVPVAIASATFTVVFWMGLREREDVYVGTNTQTAINSLAGAISYEIEQQLVAADRMAHRWGQDEQLGPEEWEADARLLRDEISGCTAVTWVTPYFDTYQVYPRPGNEAFLSFHHDTVPERRATLNQAASRLGPVLSASLVLLQGSRGYVIYSPIIRQSHILGYAGCDVSYQRLFAAVDRRAKLAGLYRYVLSIGADPVFSAGSKSEEDSPYRLESVFNLFDRRLRIEMSPSAENLQHNRRPLPEVALIAGFGITALLGLSVHFARKARSGLHDARLSNERLRSENDERRRVEEMLKISDERLRLALDSTQIGIFEWSLTTNQLYYSSGVWSMLGYLPGVIPPTPEAWTALIHPDDLAGYRQAVESQLKGETPFIEPEYRVRSADGEWRWVYTRSRTVNRSNSGAPLRIIGTIQDITPRKRGEQALRESQAAARKLSFVASSTDNLVVIARPNGTIEWVNESFERAMEYSLAEIDGKNPATFLIGPETAARTVRQITIAMRRGQGISTEIISYSKSGKKYHLQLEVQPVHNESGVIENFIGVMGDISARVETERNLRRAKAEADAASKAKSEFLASMSHEIRTPMNGVIGMTSLLLETKLTHEQKDYVSTIRNSGEALLTIINDILDFSKIESGKMELENLPFDLSVCIEESLDLFSVAAAQKNVELNYFIDDAAPSWIVGDITRLRQVLVNLVNNAVKFTPAGQISITVTRVGPPDPNPANPGPVTIEIAVADTGIGIPTDRMNRLFRPFSQVDSSTTRKYGGTGLGLAICHRLCALMGNGIHVSSTPNQGSTFTFTVHTQPVPTPPGWGLPEMPVRLNYGPILCLEDNPVCQRRLETFFRSWGGRALCAASVEAASEFLAGDAKPSVLVLDYDLLRPQTAAPFVARILEAEIPTVFLLPNAQTPATDIPRQQRISVVSKPLRTLSLVRAVQAVFNTLPDSTPPFAYAPAAQRLLAHEIPLDVLLVEDNPVNQKVALRFLQRLGYRADAVGNGIEAVHTLESRRYDLVLMDLQMPEMDGFEASRHIRKSLPLEQQPRIVALTANALSGDRELCLAAGMNDYIAKPVKIHEIADAIRRQFSGSQPPFRVASQSPLPPPNSPA